MCKDSAMRIDQICQTINIIFHSEHPFWVKCSRTSPKRHFLFGFTNHASGVSPPFYLSKFCSQIVVAHRALRMRQDPPAASPSSAASGGLRAPPPPPGGLAFPPTRAALASRTQGRGFVLGSVCAGVRAFLCRNRALHFLGK